MRLWWRPVSISSPWESSEAIREELFSTERLEGHARSLAAAQPVAIGRAAGLPLARRLADNAAALLDAYRQTVAAIDKRRAITPAAEWLVDNYHLIERHILEISKDMPPGFYRQLPKLAAGPFSGYPRVFGLAWAFVAHTDSRFDADMLVCYLRAYQSVQPLEIGELWAVSITLRIVLIENLRRLAQQTVNNRDMRHQANEIADRLLDRTLPAAQASSTVMAILREHALPPAMVVQLLHRLRDQDPDTLPVLAWLDQRLKLRGTNADDVVDDVHRRQGSTNVTVRNIITSLRRIGDVDWKDLFELSSPVDDVLALSGTFLGMDFTTRNLYRSAIEDLARGSRRTELEIARCAVEMAQAAGSDGTTQDDARQADPGYFLLAGGRRALERLTGYRPTWRQRPLRYFRALGVGAYVTAIAVVTATILGIGLYLTAQAGATTAVLVLLGLTGAMPCIELAMALVNRFVLMGAGTAALPGLALKQGVPLNLRTVVAVPTLLTSLPNLAEQLAQLEVHHLASPDGELYFALLSDWADAAEEHVATDDLLVDAAKVGIARLNARHGPAPGGPRFLLLHRRRVWSPGEGCWMGWERKRGKLHELNRLLRGASDTGFLACDGGSLPENVRYVLTLDADTRLPRDVVRRLIGKMAHPLNRPRFDTALGRVVEGYGLLQPRITASLPIGREGSLFQRVFSSLAGIDPYAAAMSDHYQDLFGEGSYAGKGIYDIDAFEAALAGRVPDGTVLSHDLFEGTFARAALASDVELVEDFPTRYDVSALRLHRWARGDWQLLPWILGRGHAGTDPARVNGAVPAFGRWKMLDNLRRTLVAPMTVLTLLAGWALPFEIALAWTVFVAALLLSAPLLLLVSAIIPRHSNGITLSSHLWALFDEGKQSVALAALTASFLAHQAWLMSDAILRTLWRLWVSHRHLLQWVPAAQTSNAPRLPLAATALRMAGSLVIAATALIIAVAAGGGNWLLCLPLVLPWAFSPLIALRISRQAQGTDGVQLGEVDTAILRLTARRTWRFFETVVTEADNMLPPDNFQEVPTPALARRTSPTNMGLYLLSVVAARDFGWIGTHDAVSRLQATLDSMGRLEKYRGHFLNWYDTADLRALDPKYVSSVDSGNLAGHLIALANACEEWQSTVPSRITRLAGIIDTLALVREAWPVAEDGSTAERIYSALDNLAHVIEALAEQGNVNDPQSSLRAHAEQIAALLHGMTPGTLGTEAMFWVEACLECIQSHQRDAVNDTALTLRLQNIADLARSMVLAMDFTFLFDPQRQLLSIGYLLPEGANDPSCYDLLASEARLASFIAIAKGDLPARHWFRLGRAITPVGHRAALISWSGSMFEYLMPSLVMRAPGGSMLEQTSRLIVRRQIAYAAELRIPWGMSESAYNVRDLEFTYQYSNFGIPSLGLKRGLRAEIVIAPYATALAAMVDAKAAAANLTRLAAMGCCGVYGFHEAVDFTPARLPKGQSMAVIQSYMAHHQGMIITAIANTLFDGVLRQRFHTEPMVRATELLLQERTPRDVPVTHHWAATLNSKSPTSTTEPVANRRFDTPHQTNPATHLLSNGRMTTLLTAAGAGYLRWGSVALTRWREDPTCDDHGAGILIQDVEHRHTWSAAYYPCRVDPDGYEVTFHEDRAEFIRRDGALTTSLDILISAEDDAEVRRVTITNNGDQTHHLEITSYLELVLGPQAADIAHPAFAKLFVHTEYLHDVDALVATRRRRVPGEPEIWLAHMAVTEGIRIGDSSFETDRALFLGRGRSLHNAVSMEPGQKLSNSVGTVLDPIFALRQTVQLAPKATIRIAFWTLAAVTRADLLDMIDRHRDAPAFARAATLAWTQGQVQLHHLGVGPGSAALFQRLASHLIHATPALRPASAIIQKGSGPQSDLWAHGISGDLPLMLLRIADGDDLAIVREVLLAFNYWRMKRLAIDLVILNDHPASYQQDLQMALEALIRSSRLRQVTGHDSQPGTVYLLRSEMIPPQTHALLHAAARVVLVARRGGLGDQLDRIKSEVSPPILPPRWLAVGTAPAALEPGMEFFNGIGGFTRNGSEYVILLGPGITTPAPWINVIANPGFGFQVAAEGSGFSWAGNSRENQLTPWSNDPVTDRSGEALYLRDQDNGALWSPTASPIRNPAGRYTARHGWGYSRFTHSAQGIASDLLVYVPVDAPVKIARLTLHNTSTRPRSLTATAYVEWVLGPSRNASQTFISTAIDAATGAMFARNPWNGDFGGHVAFADWRGLQTDWTGDRREFIGRNGSLAHPLALAGSGRLSKRVGAGLDPCGALRVPIELPPGGRVEVVFLLGQAENADAARTLVNRYRIADLDAEFSAVGRQWRQILGKVQVSTPDRSLDIMLNGWLLYQTLACRIWARSAFYQASGAYGFRDQLQDGMALAMTCPELTRAHILRAAGRQFVEGDVQHWWLPPSGRGVRTRISDDRVWLAFAVAHYVEATADIGILDVMVGFLEGPPLHPGGEDNFFQPTPADDSASLFEHCARALDASLALGRHGLPLMGTGDWNDGMNRVGEGGEGESVWLGWLLHTTLLRFATLAQARADAHAEPWLSHAAGLKLALDTAGWDGNWYRRGYFDDGTPLGAAARDECCIDSIAQSWAVLSGAGNPARAAQAMTEVEARLIRPADDIALLFTPPFVHSQPDPGYIQAYPPGIRENGGQYTHAALWSVMALAALGRHDSAANLLHMLNPINHAADLASAHRYGLEPYAVAADIYSVSPHVGRGGWSWYTGAAGWMQRAGVESVLGLRLQGDDLTFEPRLPAHWSNVQMTLRHGSTYYDIHIDNSAGTGCCVVSMQLDGVDIGSGPVRLSHSGSRRRLQVQLGGAT